MSNKNIESSNLNTKVDGGRQEAGEVIVVGGVGGGGGRRG